MQVGNVAVFFRVRPEAGGEIGGAKPSEKLLTRECLC